MKRIPQVDTYKTSAIKAARELFYGDEVIQRLKNAETDDEISRIMSDARVKKQYKEESWINRVVIKKRGVTA